VRGLGAWVGRTGALGGGGPRRIGVSEVSAIEDAHLLYGELEELDGGAATPGFRSLVRSVWRTRNFGDCWMYGLLAEGAAEIVIEPDLNTWDLAAPAVIVEEAGGRVTDIAGERSIRGRSVVATNGRLHEEVLARLRG
jgi:histidinol-phosphatase